MQVTIIGTGCRAQNHRQTLGNISATLGLASTVYTYGQNAPAGQPHLEVAVATSEVLVICKHAGSEARLAAYKLILEMGMLRAIVVIEKPVLGNELPAIQLLAQKGFKLLFASQWRWSPIVLSAAKAIRMVGGAKKIEGRAVHSGPPESFLNLRRKVIADLAIHPLEILSGLTGLDPEVLSCESSNDLTAVIEGKCGEIPFSFEISWQTKTEDAGYLLSMHTETVNGENITLNNQAAAGTLLVPGHMMGNSAYSYLLREGAEKTAQMNQLPLGSQELLDGRWAMWIRILTEKVPTSSEEFSLIKKRVIWINTCYKLAGL